MDNRFQAYRQINIKTMNRGKIVVMLYSGAITFLNKAKVYMMKGDHAKKGKFIIKAQDIINELNCSLDMQKGEQIASNLRSLYLFLNRYLVKANLSNNPEMIDRAIEILARLKSAFEEILTKTDDDEVKVINKKEVTQHAIRRYV